MFGIFNLRFWKTDMKNQLFATTIVACLAVALAAPIAAPADPIAGQVSAPVAKTKRVVPAVARMNTPVTRAVGSRLSSRLVPTEAPAEACVYDDNYSTGANNNGTTFCSKKLGYQELPPERQGRTSAANVPDGYVLVLYAGPGQSGATCRLVGSNAGVNPSCDNMARGISLERNVGAAQAAQQEDARRQAQETNALATASGAAWAANVKAQQEAAAAEEAARQAAHDARAAEEREALSRMRQRDRQEADARDAAAAVERQRVAAEEAGKSERTRILEQLVANANGCLVSVSRSTPGILTGTPESTCINESTQNIGNSWNDDIEWVWFSVPRYDPSRIVVTLFENENYQGRSLRLICGNYKLAGEVGDEVTSIKIEILPTPMTCFNGSRFNTKYDWDR
jgi:hypothetical protein